MGGLTALAQAIIGSMIPPRDRGKYSGYMGAVMAVGTAGGPLLGGFIVDSPLGWRWTFFVCVPLAVVALILLQVTLQDPARQAPRQDRLARLHPADLRRQPAPDLGLLRRQPGLLRLVVLAVGPHGGRRRRCCWPCWCWSNPRWSSPSSRSRSSPSAPPPWPSSPPWPSASPCSAPSTFLGQYFQVARGATPTEAGLLTLPMIAGNLIGSVVSGQLISRTGKWKRLPVGRRPSC